MENLFLKIQSVYTNPVQGAIQEGAIHTVICQWRI